MPLSHSSCAFSVLIDFCACPPLPQALRIALSEKGQMLLSADPKGDVSFQNHCVAWLLKGAAIDLRTSCEGDGHHYPATRYHLLGTSVHFVPLGCLPKADTNTQTSPNVNMRSTAVESA